MTRRLSSANAVRKRLLKKRVKREKPLPKHWLRTVSYTHLARGAAEVLHLAELYQCRYAILKERSPSFGSGQVYDGNFSATLVAGDGVLAAALKEKGITVIGESQIEKFFL